MPTKADLDPDSVEDSNKLLWCCRCFKNTIHEIYKDRKDNYPLTTTVPSPQRYVFVCRECNCENQSIFIYKPITIDTTKF